MFLSLGLPGCASAPTARQARGHLKTVLTEELPATAGIPDEALDEVATTDAAQLPEAVSAPDEAEDEDDPGVELSAEGREAIDLIEKEILAEGAEIGDDSTAVKAARGSIPLSMNRRVREWIYYFSVADRDRFQGFLNRGAYYRPVVESILARNGIPSDIYYLAMIESGYMAHARSRVAAVGFWQFMRPTGREFGLRMAQGVDERRDIVRATEAAAKYLKWLHKRLGSWYLAIAAYNGGPGRVAGAIRRGGSHDFWELARKRALPPETRQYVPKFLAATLIGKHPEKYGFKIEPQGTLGAQFPALDKVYVRPGDRLAVVARSRGVSLREVQSLNPHLVAARAPAGGLYAVWVPARPTAQNLDFEVPGVRLVKQNVKRSAQRRVSSARRSKVHSRVHVVRRGEHLTSISRRYGVSLPELRRCNHLRGNQIFRGQKLRIPAAAFRSGF